MHLIRVLGGGLVVATLGGWISSVDAAVVVGNSSGQVWIRNGDLTDVVTDTGFGVVTDIEMLATGIAIADSSGSGRVYVRNAATLGEAVPSVTGFGDIRALAVLPNGRLVVGNSAGDVSVREDNLTGVVGSSGFGTISDIEILSTGIAISNTNDQRVYVRDPNTLGEAVPAVSGFGTIVDTAVLNSGHLAVANSAGDVAIRSSADLSGIVSNFGFGPITAMVVLADGNIAIGNSEGRLYIRDTALGEAIPAVDGYGTISALLALSDGNILVGNAEGVLRVVSPTLGQPVLHFNSGFGAISALAEIPEPASVALIALGAPMLLVRRRRQ